MSDMITHWGVFEDCRLLSLADERMDGYLAEIMDSKKEISRLGALSRAGSVFVPHVLKQQKEVLDSEGLESVNLGKLAYALGGITHYPADIMMKPLAKEKTRVDWHEEHVRMKEGGPLLDSPAREVSAYYDTHVFRKVYLAGKDNTFSRFFMGENSTEPGKELESLVYSLFQRALLSSHTLAPDKENLDEWLDNLLARFQPLYINIQAFVDVFLNPDSKKMEEYGVETDFYLETDPVILTARKLQRGETVPQDEIEKAMDEESNSSGYAKAVCIGMSRLIDASLFWIDETDETPDVLQGGKKRNEH
jgi:hypothetical protein